VTPSSPVFIESPFSAPELNRPKTAQSLIIEGLTRHTPPAGD
jgi:hypothetical protein